MKIEKVRKRLRKGTIQEIQRLGRDLGHELPRARIDLLREFRAAVVEEGGFNWKLPEGSKSDAYKQGFLQALTEVTAAYEAAIEKGLSTPAED